MLYYPRVIHTAMQKWKLHEFRSSALIGWHCNSKSGIISSIVFETNKPLFKVQVIRLWLRVCQSSVHFLVVHGLLLTIIKIRLCRYDIIRTFEPNTNIEFLPRGFAPGARWERLLVRFPLVSYSLLTWKHWVNLKFTWNRASILSHNPYETRGADPGHYKVHS